MWEWWISAPTHTNGATEGRPRSVMRRVSPPSTLDGLAQVREVDDRAAHQGGSHFQPTLARSDGVGDVRVAAELNRGEARVPVKDLEVPGAAGIAAVGWDRVERVAASGILGQSGQQPRALHGWDVAVSIDDVVDDIPMGQLLGGLGRGRYLRCAFVFNELVVVKAGIPDRGGRKR